MEGVQKALGRADEVLPVTIHGESPRRPLVAITGGIAMGKSTVLSFFAERGFRTESSDRVAAAVFEDPVFNLQLARLAGTGKSITRDQLRTAIADRPELRRAANRLLHPEIGRRVRASNPEIVEVPLLFEACLNAAYSRIWVVACQPEIQLSRLVERYNSQVHAEAIIASQLPIQTKLAFADEIIRTDGPIQDVHEKLSQLLGLLSK